MATSAPQTLICRCSTDLTSPLSPPSLTPTIINAKSKRRYYHNQQWEQECVLQASLITALPQYPAPLDSMDELVIAKPAADTNNSHNNNNNSHNNNNNNNNTNTNSNNSQDADSNADSDHNSNSDQNQQKPIIETTDDHSVDDQHIDTVSDSDEPSSPIMGIGLRPISKPVSVVVDNTRRKRRARSLVASEDDDVAAPSTRQKRARANKYLTRKTQKAIQAAARVRDPESKTLTPSSPIAPASAVRKTSSSLTQPLARCLVRRALSLARMPRTKEAAHQTLKFRFDIDAELQKANKQKFWRQVQLSVLYHTFQLRNEIRSLKNFAPVPASEMLVGLDEFDNALAAGADNDLDFLEEDDDDNHNVEEDDDDDNNNNNDRDSNDDDE
ncbi:hypothetical protein AN5093.2 [Aspergillus nidulans FGSC A4]|uniref:Serine-leucine-rich repeat protein (AFU_orthologue AFUA_8G02230) n=1 Tax=Emericella nidulans (strain FGSC A4 / ATCC 38163 / CBS 112.46 / NRRL 194 / M139) TaxID=227321 RepID=Q5B2Y7_EMENI|nr:hypothetical protein [Aspergillus nidulans FGSC A4]EAA60188.1 hypothetical protein AN5093.2 [Aspergillus nidulans FGSC A4]CBF76093.1 TPA: serine-leucine-rich repeat protein (AFU_orthologue; AFUA_8G02230) [Aspergillus nidulans FGSC A4]|eukprot:XP_662697.1 hypothetical protein AN5093.2 [Aspergillus nidulans FGSC A4]